MSPTMAKAESLLQADGADKVLTPVLREELVQAISKQPKGKPLAKQVMKKAARLSGRSLRRLGKQHLVEEDARVLGHLLDIKTGGGGASSRGGGGALSSRTRASAASSSRGGGESSSSSRGGVGVAASKGQGAESAASKKKKAVADGDANEAGRGLTAADESRINAIAESLDAASWERTIPLLRLSSQEQAYAEALLVEKQKQKHQAARSEQLREQYMQLTWQTLETVVMTLKEEDKLEREVATQVIKQKKKEEAEQKKKAKEDTVVAKRAAAGRRTRSTANVPQESGESSIRLDAIRVVSAYSMPQSS